MGMGLVWVSIFFDLLMSVEMGFQPWCLWRKWVCSDFLFFPLFDVWVYFNGLIGVMIVGMGLVWVSILFDLLMSAEMGFQPWCLWRKRVCKFFFFSFVWCLGLLQWFDRSDDHGYGFSLGKHFLWFIDKCWDGFSIVVNLWRKWVCSVFFFSLCLIFGFASMVWSEWWPWVWV